MHKCCALRASARRAHCRRLTSTCWRTPPPPPPAPSHLLASTPYTSCSMQMQTQKRRHPRRTRSLTQACACRRTPSTVRCRRRQRDRAQRRTRASPLLATSRASARRYARCVTANISAAAAAKTAIAVAAKEKVSCVGYGDHAHAQLKFLKPRLAGWWELGLQPKRATQAHHRKLYSTYKRTCLRRSWRTRRRHGRS